VELEEEPTQAIDEQWQVASADQQQTATDREADARQRQWLESNDDWKYELDQHGHVAKVKAMMRARDDARLGARPEQTPEVTAPPMDAIDQLVAIELDALAALDSPVHGDPAASDAGSDVALSAPAPEAGYRHHSAVAYQETTQRQGDGEPAPEQEEYTPQEALAATQMQVESHPDGPPDHQQQAAAQSGVAATQPEPDSGSDGTAPSGAPEAKIARITS
jgi:hypothetical protein